MTWLFNHSTYRSNNFFHVSTRTLFRLSLSAELWGGWPNIPWCNGTRTQISNIYILSDYATLFLFILVTPVEFSFILKDKMGPDDFSTSVLLGITTHSCLTSNSSHWNNWRWNREEITFLTRNQKCWLF